MSSGVVKVLVALALLVTVGWVLYSEGERSSDARWSAAVEKLKLDAKNKLDAETERVRKLDSDLNTLKQQSEADREKQNQELDAQYALNKRLASQLGGLRDPGRRRGGGCTAAPAAGAPAPADQGTAGAELSVEASSFLLELARQCDDAASYAQQCHQWAVSAQQRFNTWAAEQPGK